MKSFFAATSFSLLSLASAATQKYSLSIVDKTVAPDGVSRVATLVDGVFPGPLISGNKGDTFKINVIDELNDDSMWMSTSIHWHGLHQNKTNYADGVSWVTQCPIAANESFLYQFSVPDQAGTFWYHSHFAAQYCDGLKGPLVIYDPNDPHKDLYDVDNQSTILTLSDWYHESSKNFVQVGQVPAPAESILFNGLGRFSGSEAGLSAQLAVVNVEHGKRYRIRLVQTSCEADLEFSIDGHDMTIIEVEGTNVEPYTVDQIYILAGQRYSFVLNANQPIGNYWMRALPYTAWYPGVYNFSGGVNSAILRYKGAKSVEPTSIETNSTNPYVETALVPLQAQAAPGNPWEGGADVSINLAMAINFTTAKYMINGASWSNPTAPVLLQILSGTMDAQSLLPSGSVYTLPSNKVIEISIPGNSAANGGPHPMHLHGHDFYVVRSAGSNTTNYKNPIRRDTVNTGFDDSNVTIRFRSDNAGPWFLHCHIDWHLELGMAVVFAEAPQLWDSEIKPTSDWEQLCPNYSKLSPDQY